MFTEIPCPALWRQIGLPDQPLVIDVRLPEDVAADPFLVPASARARAQDVLALAPRIGPAGAVLACKRGRKLSHGAAALLRAAGLRSEVLEGGILAWAEAGLPRIALAALPAGVAEGTGSLWVTRARPKIDRIACPWLIRRFVDPLARVLYVPAGDVLEVADRFGATAFDIEGAPHEHDGPLCTFDTLIRHFGLAHAALDRLALVVRAADTDRHDLTPEAAGLLALSVGLSRAWKDDQAQLEAALPLYDALYRWARDGQGEGHDWPAGRVA